MTTLNILVVRKHNQIGDMLCSLSLYKAIKKKYPDSHITLVASKTNYEIPFFELNPYINRVLVYDKSSIKTILKFYKQLRDRKYQIGLVPSTIRLSTTSHIINLLSGAKLRVGVKSIDGKANKSEWMLNLKKDFNWKSKHQLQRNLEIANLIEADLTEEELAEIKFNFNENDIKFAEEFIFKNGSNDGRKKIAFHPGGGKKDNIWPAENFVELIEKLNDSFTLKVFLTYGKIDYEIINAVTERLKEKKINYSFIDNNISIKQQAAILSLMDLYITNDTGAMHIAGFGGAKMISLFGPTNPQEWAPLNKNTYYLRSISEKIYDIKVEEVLSLAKKILNNA